MYVYGRFVNVEVLACILVLVRHQTMKHFKASIGMGNWDEYCYSYRGR